eukprot:g311.t1
MDERQAAVWARFFENVGKRALEPTEGALRELDGGIRAGDVEAVTAALLAGADPCVVGPHGGNALHVACEVGNKPVIALLIEHDADVDAPDTQGASPLHVAVRGAHADCVAFLLSCAASATATDAQGRTPLQLAALCEDDSTREAMRGVLHKYAAPEQARRSGGEQGHAGHAGGETLGETAATAAADGVAAAGARKEAAAAPAPAVVVVLRRLKELDERREQQRQQLADKGSGGGGSLFADAWVPPLPAPGVALAALRQTANPSAHAFNCAPLRARMFVVKSFSEDDVHKAVKYGLWTSLPHNNAIFASAWENEIGPVYFLFSVNKSGRFVALAQMDGGIEDRTFALWAKRKFDGFFRVKWIFVKDVPFDALKHITLPNNGNRPMVWSRDGQEIPLAQAHAVLRVWAEHGSSSSADSGLAGPCSSLLSDFAFYEAREAKMRERLAAKIASGDASKRLVRGSEHGPRHHRRPSVNSGSESECQ